MPSLTGAMGQRLRSINRSINTLRGGGGAGGGGAFPFERAGMLVVSLRGVNCRFGLA